MNESGRELEKTIAAEMLELVEVDREMQELMRYHRRVEVLSVALKQIAVRSNLNNVTASFNYATQEREGLDFDPAAVDWLYISKYAWELYESVRRNNMRLVLDVAWPYENVVEMRVRTMTVAHQGIVLPPDMTINVMDEDGKSTYTICGEGVEIESGSCDEGYVFWLTGVLDTIMTQFAPK